MGCLLWLAHEANGFSKIPTLLRTVLVGAIWRWHRSRRLKGELKQRKLGQNPANRFPGLAARPSKSNVCVCPKGGRAAHAGQYIPQVT